MPQRSDEPFHQWRSPGGDVWTQFFRLDDTYLIRFPELADFEVSSDGVHIRCSPVPGANEDTIEHLYLNQVVPLAMSRQRKLVLHGSAVDIGGFGVAFLGESGMGKSTLAASFAVAGSHFLTDDGLWVDWKDGVCRILPSHASIRLWEDSEQALAIKDSVRAPTLSFTSKSRLLAGKGLAFSNEPTPLKRIYFLGFDEPGAPEFTPLTGSEAVIHLMQNSFLLDGQRLGLQAFQFDEICRLSQIPMFYRIDYPREFHELPQVRAAIADHLSARP